MQHKPSILFFILCFFFLSIADAQSVLYSSVANKDINTTSEIIGKAGNFYWLYKIKKTYSYKNGRTMWPPIEDCFFEVYDGQLTRVAEIPVSLSNSVLKQYLIPQR